MPLLLVVLLGIYLVLWWRYKLRGRGAEWGQVALILAFTGMLLDVAVQRLYDANALDLQALPRPYVVFIRDIFAELGAVSLYLVRLAADKCTICSRRVVKTVGVAVALAVILALIATVLLPPGASLSYSQSFGNPVTAAYHILANTYLGAVLLVVANWLFRSAGVEEKHLRRGLRISAVAVYGLTVLMVLRALLPAIAILGGPIIGPPNDLFYAITDVTVSTLVVGLSYQLLVSRVSAFRTWRRQRSVYLRLDVVWRTCITVYPELVVRIRTLTRRRTECVDALAKFLAGNKPAADKEARRAADALRKAIARYDATHDVPVASVLHRAPTGPVETAAQARSPDHLSPGTVMLLALNEILVDVLRDGLSTQQSP